MRAIVIGDIHGCIEELRELLDALAIRPGERVVCVGDIVAKGPASEACIDLLVERGIESVLGNQDLRWIETRPRGTRESWLAARPLAIELPERGVIVVHGGIVPGTRTIDPDLRFVRFHEGTWRPVPKGEEQPGDVFWADVWDGRQTVVYGHAPTPSDAPRLSERAIGIDTGCVYGGSLTAGILEDGRWSFTSVKAKQAYAKRRR